MPHSSRARNLRALLLLIVLSIAAAAIALPASAGAAPPPAGALIQLPGTQGCVSSDGSSEEGANTCAVGTAIDGPESAILSPDGKNLYVGSYKSVQRAGLSIFSTSPTSGVLTQLAGSAGCFTATGASQLGAGTCGVATGFGTGDGRDIAFTSDGGWAYMVNQHNSGGDPAASILIFQRDPSSGALTQLPGTAGCISSDGSSQAGAATCQTLATLGTPNGISISSDDRFLYVTDYNSSVTRIHVLARDPSSGGLSEVQCLAEAPGITGCDTGRVLGNSKTVVLSPDGTHAYAADYGAGISIFDRNPTTGKLTQKPGDAGCITPTGNDNTGAATCGSGRGLAGAETIAIAPDGRTFYAMAYSRKGFSVFHVETDGTLTQLAGTAGCTTLDGKDESAAATCAVGRGLDGPYGVVISPDGRYLYVTEYGGPIPEGGVAVFSLDPSSGAATQLPGLAGCTTADGNSGSDTGVCTNGRALAGGYDPIVTPNGAFFYMAANKGKALAAFAREVAPTCQDASRNGPFGKAMTLTLACTDANGEAITRTIVSGPAHGTLGPIDQAAGTVAYTPKRGYAGPDSFKFAATDGTNTSAPATASTSVGARVAFARVSQSAKRWRLGKRLATITRKRKAPVGTNFKFVLNEAAKVKLNFTQSVKGRKVGGRCLPHGKRSAKKCTLTVSRGKLTLSGKQGRNKIHFEGRLSRRKALKPGSYTLILTATDSAGVTSAPKRLTFTIVKR
jgi:DNA-binding beta-propeller fold protein YncE